MFWSFCSCFVRFEKSLTWFTFSRDDDDDDDDNSDDDDDDDDVTDVGGWHNCVCNGGGPMDNDEDGRSSS